MKTLLKISLLLLFTLIGTYSRAQSSALLWATYFGGDTTTLDGSMVIDDSGNVYMAGWTENPSGIATSGAYQTSNGGGADVFLAKFSPSGALIWATYFGGSGDDYGGGIAINKSGNLYISGYTNSPSGIATSGAYQTSFSGYNKAFLAEFSPSGTLIWATYFGGNKDDGVGGLAIDASNNIFISGQTSSDSGIATFGAYQTLYGGGTDDAFLAKFSSSGSLLWATYFGGSGKDISNDITKDANGNIYIDGQTYSTSGIATSGAYQTSYIGSSDGFLAKFNASGSLLWATYYGKKGENFGITTDIQSNVYITGVTYSTTGIATKGAYQTSGDGVNGTAFLAKFGSSGSLLWGTYYAGSGALGDGVVTDLSGNVYITGFTDSYTNIATSGAYQTYNTGGFEAFLSKFNPIGSLLYATYYGGYSSNYGEFVATDTVGNVYISGDTYSTTGIATSGAYQSTGGGIQETGFLAKFHINTYYDDAGIPSIINPIGSFCADSIPVKIELKNYGPDTLKSVNINWTINSKLQTTYNWTGNLKTNNSTIINLGKYNFTVGIDTIVVWVSPVGFIDTIPGNDTAKIIDTINALPNASFAYTLKDDTVKFTPVNTSYTKYSWSFGDGHISDSIKPIHIYSNGTYTVSLNVTDKIGCSATYTTTDTVNYIKLSIENSQTQNIKISPNPFTDNITVSYFLQSISTVNAAVYDITGRLINVLYNGMQLAEKHEIKIDGNNYIAGVYILKIQIDNDITTQKLIKIN